MAPTERTGGVLCVSSSDRSPVEEAYVDYADRLHDADETRMISRYEIASLCRNLGIPATWGRSAVGVRAYYALRAMEPLELLPYSFPVSFAQIGPSEIRECLTSVCGTLQRKVMDVFGVQRPLLILAKRCRTDARLVTQCCIGLEHDSQRSALRYIVASMAPCKAAEFELPISLVRDRVDWTSANRLAYGLREMGRPWLAYSRDLDVAAKQIYLDDLSMLNKWGEDWTFNHFAPVSERAALRTKDIRNASFVAGPSAH